MLLIGAEWQQKVGFAIGLAAVIALGSIIHPLAAYTYLAGLTPRSMQKINSDHLVCCGYFVRNVCILFST